MLILRCKLAALAPLAAIVAAGATATTTAMADLDVAAAEARRYADCLIAVDAVCIHALTHPLARIHAFGAVNAYPNPERETYTEGSEYGYQPLTQNATFIASMHRYVPLLRDTGWTMDLGTPTLLELEHEFSFALIPYRQRLYVASLTERSGYLVGVSDNGTRWCFLDDTAVIKRGRQRVLPGYAGALPAMSVTVTDAPGRTRSDYLDTTVGAFAVTSDEGAAHYVLTLDVTRRVRDTIPLTVVYQNPEDPEQPLILDAVIERRQKELELKSPLISGFEQGNSYIVAIFAVDPATDEILFEHLQPMVFRPIPGRGEQFMPAVQGMQGGFVLEPVGFPADWYKDIRGASINQLCEGSVASG